MSIYIPLALLYVPLFIALWLAFGWVWRTAIFMVFPGMALGLDRRSARRMTYWGPLGIWMIFALYSGKRVADRIRAQYKAEQEGHEP